MRSYRQTDFYKQLGHQLGIEDKESVCPVSEEEEKFYGKQEQQEKAKSSREDYAEV